MKIDGVFELGFHFAHELECPEGFGARELAEVKPEIVVGGADFSIAFDDVAAGVNASLREVGPLGVIGGKFGPIETSAGELPGRLGTFRLLLTTLAGLTVEPL